MRLEKQGSKPTGLIGILIGRLMNKFQTTVYVDYIKNKLTGSKRHKCRTSYTDNSRVCRSYKRFTPYLEETTYPLLFQ